MSAPLVVLDIGATLIDGPERGPASRIAGAIGLDAGRERDLHQLLMTTDYANPADVCTDIRERLGVTSLATESAVKEIWYAQETEGHLIPGAFEALQGLVKNGYRLALLSNIWTPYLRSVRRLLSDFLDTHIRCELQLFSCREGHAKPARELLDRLIERAVVLPKEVIMIGDSYDSDIDLAARSGMRTVWILRNPGREAFAVIRILNGVAATPTLTLSSLTDFDFDCFALCPQHWQPDSKAL